jgi:hypothetical protein
MGAMQIPRLAGSLECNDERLSIGRSGRRTSNRTSVRTRDSTPNSRFCTTRGCERFSMKYRAFGIQILQHSLMVGCGPGPMFPPTKCDVCDETPMRDNFHLSYIKLSSDTTMNKNRAFFTPPNEQTIDSTVGICDRCQGKLKCWDQPRTLELYNFIRALSKSGRGQACLTSSRQELSILSASSSL